MAKKIKFTSKKNPKPSKLARAGGDGGGRPALVPGYYCQGTVTVRLNSGNVSTI